MTIDDAIAKYKEITNTDVNCPAYCNISCEKCIQESKQILEWLEELVRLRLDSCMIHLSERLSLVENGYNKAIYDFALALKNNYDDMPLIISKDDFNDFIDNNADLLIRGGKINMNAQNNDINWEEVPESILNASITDFIKIVDDAQCYGFSFRIADGKIQFTDDFVNNLFTI